MCVKNFCRFLCVLCGELEQHWVIFYISISNLTLCSLFSFETVLTVKNKLNDSIEYREIRR